MFSKRNKIDADHIVDRIAGLAAELEREKKLRMDAEALAHDMRWKVLFSEALESAGDCRLVGEVAKILRANGVEISCEGLFSWLKGREMVDLDAAGNLAPSEFSFGNVLMVCKPNRHGGASYTPMLTVKGQQYVLYSFLHGESFDV